VAVEFAVIAVSMTGSDVGSVAIYTTDKTLSAKVSEQDTLSEDG